MELDVSTKKGIDNMTYRAMLELWRTAPMGHHLFQGQIGKYFKDIMNEKRKQIGQDGHVAFSKSIGWDK